MNDNVDLILERMSVNHEKNIYVLGCLERPATVYMQQVRALNLVYALGQNRVHKGRLVVVGAGAGGTTVAAAAAIDGWDVTILDEYRGEVLCLAGSTSSKRWLHPNIYDWPAKGADEPRSSLGVLDWTAGPATGVIAEMRTQWARIAKEFGIEAHLGCTNVTIDRRADDAWLVQWNGSGAQGQTPSDAWGMREGKRLRQTSADVLILAVGFGEEKSTSNDFPSVKSYWKSDDIDDTLKESTLHPAVLVSGTGDGGLIDVLRYSFHNFKHEDVLRRLREEWLGEETFEEVRLQLIEIERRALESQVAGEPYEAELNWAYKSLADQLVLKKPIQMRSDVTVVLTGRGKFPLSLTAAPINRFLFCLTGAQFKPKGIASQEGQAGEWKVRFNDGTSVTFFDVVIRHGATAVLPASFPEIHAKHVEARDLLGDAAKLGRDPTRDILFDPTFGEVLKAASRQVASLDGSQASSASDIFVALSQADAEARLDPLAHYRAFLESDLGTMPSHYVDQPNSEVQSFLATTERSADVTKSTSSEHVRLLVGPPGAGKTAYLRALAINLSSDGLVAPLLVNAVRLCNDGAMPFFVSAIDEVLSSISNDAEAHALLRSSLLRGAMEGRLVVLVDNLDSLDNDAQEVLLQRVEAAIVDLRRGNKVLIASRPLPAMHATRDIRAIELKGMSRPDVASLIKKWNVHFGGAVENFDPSEGSRGFLRQVAITLAMNLASSRGPTLWSRLLSSATINPLSETPAWARQFGRAAVRSLAERRVALDTPIELLEGFPAEARWLLQVTETSGSPPAWEFRHANVRDALAAWSLAKSAQEGAALAGLVYGASGIPLPVLGLAFKLASRSSETMQLLKSLPDTLDFRMLRLCLISARYGIELSQEATEQLGISVATIVLTARAASFETVMELAEACRGLPLGLASALAGKLTLNDSSEDVAIMYRTLRFIGKARLPGAVEKLQPYLLSSTELLADAAAEAFGERKISDAIPILADAYRTSNRRQVFSKAIDAIVDIGGAKATETLVSILSDSDLYQNLRWPAAVALGKLPEEAALQPLIVACGDARPVIRENAANALGSRPGRQSTACLVQLLWDVQDSVRISAAQSLSRIAELEDVPALHTALDDTHIVVRTHAALGLERLDPTGLAKALQTAIANETGEWRAEASSLLGQLMGEAALPIWRALSKERDRYARMGAARGLAGITGNEAIDLLDVLAHDDDEDVRYTALGALPRDGNPIVADILAASLEREGETAVGILAAQMLRDFRSASGVSALRKAIHRPGIVAKFAASSLGSVGDENDIGGLLAAWRQDPDSHYMRHDSFLAGIARIGGPRAAAALRLLLDEVADGPTRKRIFQAVADVAHASAIPVILAGQTDRDEAIRDSVRPLLQTFSFERLRRGLTLGLQDISLDVRWAAMELAPAYSDETLLQALRDAEHGSLSAERDAIRTNATDQAAEVVRLREAADELLQSST